MFLSQEFRQSLLILQGSFLLLFLYSRWLEPSNMSIVSLFQMVLAPTPRSAAVQMAIWSKMTPEYVLTTLSTSNLIGILFARSLHYQFYSWFAWTIPYLLSQSSLHPVFQYLLWGAQEWAWNVYPATPVSSITVVAVNATILGSLWIGKRIDDNQFSSDSSGSSTPVDVGHISVTEIPPVVLADSAKTRSQRRRKSGKK